MDKRNSQTPYNPLELKTLAESIARVLLDQDVQRLVDLRSFNGAGVYILYYTGRFPDYKEIAAANRNDKWRAPIYIGEAARKGARKGGVLNVGPPGPALFSRLKNHLESINAASNLDSKDFWCRYLVIEDFFIPLCESLLIDRYQPIWNKVIDGFGNKVLGGNRQKLQQVSMWDVFHPGRTGAGQGQNKKFPDVSLIGERLREFLAGEISAPISTPEAVSKAEEEGEG